MKKYRVERSSTGSKVREFDDMHMAWRFINKQENCRMVRVKDGEVLCIKGKNSWESRREILESN